MQTLSPTLLNDVLKIAYQAGDYLSEFYQRSVQIYTKADNTPVTEADLFVSQFVSESLHQLTPNIPILSEERCDIPLAERTKWQQYWLIDPLDGTQQFIDRTGQFSVVISLVQQNIPTLGVIYAPELDRAYYAQRGKGAFVVENVRLQAVEKQLTWRASSSETSDRLRITVGTSSRKNIEACLRPPLSPEFLPYGSSSLKACLVAEGKADCYIRFGDTGEWDTAAAEVILAEIGGCVFDLHFQPLRYNQRPTFVNPHFVMVGNKQRAWQSIFNF